MALFFIIIFGSYGVFVLALLFGWARAMEEGVATAATEMKISVVVPFRNEQANLPGLVSSLLAQTYDPKNFEVLLVNDHSTDQSLTVAGQLSQNRPNVKVLDLKEGEGKKAALAHGVQSASGIVVVTTDADCRVPETWLMEINHAFDPQVKLVVGPVRLIGRGLFGRLQEIEMASLVGVAGGTLGWRLPSTCNGANLAFLRAAFFEVGGFFGNDKISSGDDEFLMRKIASRWSGSVRFLPSARAVVSTAAAERLGDFVHQRLRWAGKWRKNSHPPAKIMAVVILFFHSCFIGSIICCALGVLPVKVGMIIWTSKFFLEALLLITVTRFLSARWNWFSFLLLQFLYSFYVVSIGFASQVVTPVWKGRKVVSGV